MSLAQKTTGECPHCQALQDFSFYLSVNVTVDPGLKEKVLKGVLNSHNCTSCKKEINIASGFLYHDMQKKILINVVTGPEPSEFSEHEMFKEFRNNQYIYREVKSYAELIEKISLFDQNINDLVIENIANQIKETFQQVIKDNTLQVFFTKIEKGWLKKQLVFKCFTHPSQIMQIKWNFKQLSETDKAALFNLEVLRN